MSWFRRLTTFAVVLVFCWGLCPLEGSGLLDQGEEGC